MAKGQQRSNREKKKPKLTKVKPTGAVSSFATTQPGITTSPSKKK